MAASHVDCYDEDPGHDRSETPPAAAHDARPFIGIHFECCRVYARVYRQSDVMHYHGRCPRCLREVRLLVGENGLAARIFRAS